MKLFFLVTVADPFAMIIENAEKKNQLILLPIAIEELDLLY